MNNQLYCSRFWPLENLPSLLCFRGVPERGCNSVADHLLVGSACLAETSVNLSSPRTDCLGLQVRSGVHVAREKAVWQGRDCGHLAIPSWNFLVASGSALTRPQAYCFHLRRESCCACPVHGSMGQIPARSQGTTQGAWQLGGPWPSIRSQLRPNGWPRTVAQKEGSYL